jgi:hypothetical protein
MSWHCFNCSCFGFVHKECSLPSLLR